jgi:signal transduction histidine kinase
VKEGITLASPVMRVAISLPAAALLLYTLVTGRVRDPVLASVLLTAGVALAVVSVWRSTRSPGLGDLGQVLAGVMGLAILPLFLVEGIDTSVEGFGLLFVLVIVIVAFTMDGWRRQALLAWALAMWLVTLWGGGVREPDLLLFHLGGGAIVVGTVTRTANALGHAVTSEARARAATEQRAELLARLLRVHTLEREEVLETVVDGLLDTGFDAASLRVVDGEELVLAAGRGDEVLSMPDRIPNDAGLPGRCLRSGRVESVEGPEQAAAAELSRETAGAVAVPVYADDQLEGVIAGVSRWERITPEQLSMVELLASLAGRSLRRAELYEADEATVVELQRLETRTQDFVSTVSHELRTPLTVVQGLAQTLSARWDDLDAGRRDDLLRRVDANAGRLTQMVRSLLDTSAFEEGRIEVHAGAVRLRPLIDDLLHRLASVTAQHPVVLDIPEGLVVHADRALLEHVLENLLTNTAKHTPAGTRVDIAAHEADGGVEVVVRDDGPGIPAADLPHVLDRFYRGGDPASRPAGGLGLGLALARQILEAHGTAFMLDSVEGEGTRFAFVLPGPAPAQAAEPTAST